MSSAMDRIHHQTMKIKEVENLKTCYRYRLCLCC